MLPIPQESVEDLLWLGWDNLYCSHTLNTLNILLPLNTFNILSTFKNTAISTFQFIVLKNLFLRRFHSGSWTRPLWETCPVPCLPWFEPGPFSNVLEACHIPLYINYGSCRHVLEDCEVVESVRKSEGIRSFLDECRDAGLSSGSSYRNYISGLDAKGNAIPTKEHLARGGSLLRLTDEWLSIWEPQD